MEKEEELANWGFWMIDAKNVILIFEENIMEKPFVKAGGIISLTDARYFSAWGVEWLGFPVGGSPEMISPAALTAITEWIEGPHITAEFGMETTSNILAVADQTAVEGIQVNQFFPISELSALSEYTIFQEYVVEPGQTMASIDVFLQDREEWVDFFILDFSKNNVSWPKIRSGLSFNEQSLRECCARMAIYLDIPFSGQELAPLLESLKPWGLNIKGGDEEKIGFKSFEDLDEIMEVLSGL